MVSSLNPESGQIGKCCRAKSTAAGLSARRSARGMARSRRWAVTLGERVGYAAQMPADPLCADVSSGWRQPSGPTHWRSVGRAVPLAR